MRLRTWRPLLATGALLAALVSSVVAAGPASAVPVSSCTTSSGVLVVVDFRHFGGSLTRGCAASPSTGFEALHDAGYTTDGTVRDGEGFVCRIDDHPNAKQDACYYTPPATAYWSYWHANAGQSSWSYSSLGAQSYHPKAGSIDAWVFGSTDVGGTSGGPGFSPSEARGQRSAGGGGAAGPATPSRSAASPHRSTAHATSATPGRSASARASTAARSSAASTAASSSAAGTAASSAASAGVTGSSPAAPSFADASSVADKSSSSGGSALPVILGVALVLLLGAGGGWGVLRRRRADAAEH